METQLYATLPVIASVLFLLTMTLSAAGIWRRHGAWLVPAMLSAAFLAWSMHAVAVGGVFGFWSEHVRNAWSNQIWCDLLLGVALAWILLLPRARAVGMYIWPWLALVVGTGGVGLYAMMARCLFLERRAASVAFAHGADQ